MDAIEIKTEYERIFKVGVRDLLGAPVNAIVNPANSGLSHGAGLAGIISAEAGPEMDAECEKIIAKVGRIPTTYAVPTKAGNLPFRGIIHAVGPRMGTGDEQQRIETTILNVLKVAEKQDWTSVAFPAISTGIFGISKEVCATAFQNAVPAYWKINRESNIALVWLCLTRDDFPVFHEVLT